MKQRKKQIKSVILNKTFSYLEVLPVDGGKICSGIISNICQKSVIRLAY